jgi:hypothetical protein
MFATLSIVSRHQPLVFATTSSGDNPVQAHILRINFSTSAILAAFACKPNPLNSNAVEFIIIRLDKMWQAGGSA